HAPGAVERHVFPQQLVSTTQAAVVDKYQLESIARGFHDRLQAVVKSGHALLLVMERDDNRVLRHQTKIIPRQIQSCLAENAAETGFTRGQNPCSDAFDAYFWRIFTVRSSSSETSRIFSFKSLSRAAPARNC